MGGCQEDCGEGRGSCTTPIGRRVAVIEGPLQMTAASVLLWTCAYLQCIE
jgi:hypothetical protein